MYAMRLPSGDHCGREAVARGAASTTVEDLSPESAARRATPQAGERGADRREAGVYQARRPRVQAAHALAMLRLSRSRVGGHDLLGRGGQPGRHRDVELLFSGFSTRSGTGGDGCPNRDQSPSIRGPSGRAEQRTRSLCKRLFKPKGSAPPEPGRLRWIRKLGFESLPRSLAKPPLRGLFRRRVSTSPTVSASRGVGSVQSTREARWHSHGSSRSTGSTRTGWRR
jgi:hypothetical protein